MAPVPMFCRSNYYTDTGRTQHHGDREVRCSLYAGHQGEHEEWYEEGNGLLASWPQRTPEPRMWALPAEPGAEVKAIRDSAGDIWTRHNDRWRFTSGATLAWVDLLFEWAPLTDATAEVTT